MWVKGLQKKMKIMYSCFQKIKEFYFSLHYSKGAILMFHQVDNNKDNWNNPNVSITLNSFNSLIRKLISNKIEFGDINNFYENYSRVFITFDDGYLDIYENAYPVLKSYNIPFCIFITTGYLGKKNYLTPEKLKKLSSDTLCTVGSHTLTHPQLRFENIRNSFLEISTSKSILQSYISKEIKYFAYPYGSIYACSKKNIIDVKNSGYELAFSTLNSYLCDKTVGEGFFIPRINVNEENYYKLRLECVSNN